MAFYPSGGHLSTAEIISLKPGELSTRDLHTTSVPTGSIKMHSSSLEDLHYSLYMSAMGLRLQLPTDCEQSSSTHTCTFRLLPAGDYQIATESEQDGKSLKSYQDVTVRPYTHLSVPVIEPSTVHVTGALSYGSTAVKKSSIDFRSLDADEVYSNLPIDGEGEFSVNLSQPGKYVSGVHGNDDSYVCGTESGGVRSQGETLNVPSGVSTWRVNIALCPRASTITGRVNGAIDQKVKLRVAVIESDTGVGYEADTDSGSFVFSSLSPGTYIVAAWPQARAVAYMSRDVQERLSELGSHVTIEHAGDIENVEISILEGTAPLL